MTQMRWLAAMALMTFTLLVAGCGSQEGETVFWAAIDRRRPERIRGMEAQVALVSGKLQELEPGRVLAGLRHVKDRRQPLPRGLAEDGLPVLLVPGEARQQPRPQLLEGELELMGRRVPHREEARLHARLVDHAPGRGQEHPEDDS